MNWIRAAEPRQPGRGRAAPRAAAAFIAAAAMLVGCAEKGVSTLQVEQAAEARARQKLGLGEDAELVSRVFVGQPVDGETVMCGMVRGKRADGRAVEPQRFIVSTEPWKWLLFESAEKPSLPSLPGKFVEWHTTCLGEQGA